jgi:hypothetical protein
MNVRYRFLLWHKKFNTSSLFKTHITTPRHFDDTLRMREKTMAPLRCTERGTHTITTPPPPPTVISCYF